MNIYMNGNYQVIILDDGTKIRKNDLDNLTPAFAESYDITITTKCDNGCEYCYLGCNESGVHADLHQEFFNTIHPYTEVALNGNDLSHPDLEDFLIRMKNQKVIANITVNQRHLIKCFDKIKDWQDRDLVKGIGVSLVEPTDELLKLIKQLKNVVIHTICGLLTESQIEKLKDKNINLLILGYKHVGKGVEYYEKNKEEIEKNQEYLRKNILKLASHFRVISFDNLAVEQLEMKSKLPEKVWEQMYMGNEGEFTFFIDAVNKNFAESSLDCENNYPIMHNVDSMFNFLRGRKDD